MTTAKLFGTINSPSSLSTLTTSGGLNFGIEWYPEVEGYVNKLSWYYHGATSDNRRPDAITLYDAATQQVMAQFIPAAADGAAQTWTPSSITSPPHVNANQHCIVVAHYPGTAGAVWRYWYFPQTALPTPEWPLHFATNYARSSSGGIGFPSTITQGNMVMLDIEFDTAYNPNPTSPATVGSISNELAEWLHEDDSAAQPQSLPRLAWQLLTDATNGLAAIKDKAVEAVEDIASVAGDVANVSGKFGGLVGGTVASGLANVANYVGTRADDLGDLINAQADAFNAWVDTVFNRKFPNAQLGEPGWTLVDTVVTDVDLEWVQPADRYTYAWDTDWHPRNEETYGGVNMTWAKDAWWAYCRNGVVGPHGNFNGRYGDIVIPGLRFPGLLIRNGEGIPLTVQAWDYNGS